MTQALLVNMT